MRKKMNKRTALTAASCAMLGIAAVGGTLAYLTDSETTTNTFTVGKVKADLEEPNYPGNGSDEVTNIRPNDEINKDPQVENTGNNDMVAFLNVYSPMALISMVDDDGSNKTALAGREIFYMKDANDAITTHANNFENTEWTELTNKEVAYVQAVDQADGSIQYVTKTQAEAEAALWAAKFFHAVPQPDGTVKMEWIAAADIADLPAAEKVYNITATDYATVKTSNPEFGFANAAAAVTAGFAEVSRDTSKTDGAYTTAGNVQQRLDEARIYKKYVFGHNSAVAPNAKTAPIFDKVQLKNIVEGEIDTREQNIVIETYAIQADNVLSAGDYDTSALEQTDLETIYQTFVNQGTAGSGDEAQADLYKNVESHDANITLEKDLNGNMADVTKKKLDISITDAKPQVGEDVATEVVATVNGEVQTLAAGAVSYSSENENIATVDANGQVHGVAVGTTFIHAAWDGTDAKVEVTVVNAEPAVTP